MIRNISGNTNKIIRNHSNSQESTKNKKSTSAKTKNVINYSGFGLSSSVKPRQDTSTSNKKTVLNTSNSNKSLKEIGINKSMNNSINIIKKKQEKQNKNTIIEKKGTIMIKNIKSKIVGNGPTKTEKKTQFNKKIQTEANPIVNHTQITVKTPRTPNQKFKTHQSFSGLNLAIKQTQKVSLPIKLSMEMFQLGRKLGKGRFGDVYMARDRKSGFSVAIKVINKKQLKESQMQAQLIQQIKIQMFSNHPNILKMYGFFSDDNKIYLLLELATNGCLFREIRQKAYFSEDLACYYFRQVSSGIRYLHSNYVIHRDIKPENILNCFNVLKICDFGWAIYSPIYQRQTFCGTLDYVPPEIVTGQFYDEKADVWCLGVLCYQLCTGKAPFESKTDQNQTYDKILKVQIEFPIYLSPKVVDFIGRILNRDPQKRINLQEIQNHEWMRAHENQSGRTISKQIWDNWMKFTK